MRGITSARWIVSAALAIAIATTGPQAQAATGKPGMRQAKRAFKAGQTFMRLQRYADAVVEFKKAHVLTEDDLVMGQVALAYEKGGDYEQALQAIRRYREALPEADRASVDPMIARYDQLIAAGKSQPLRLPGEEPAPVAPPPPPPPPAPDPAAAGAAESGQAPATPNDATGLLDEAPRRRRVWTWVAAGTAAALGVSALVLGLSAQSKYSELEDRCGPDTGGLCAQGDVDSVRTRAVVTDVLWGSALAAGITSAVLFFVEGRGRSERGAANPDQGGGDRPGGAAPEPRDDGADRDVDDDFVRSIDLTPVLGAGRYGFGAVVRF